MKKIRFLFIVLSLLVINCEKKDRRKKTFSEFLFTALDLKNYKIDEIKINDSITEVKGINEQFETSGQLLKGKKIGYWKVKEKNSTLVIYAQYIMIDKNENFLNQYKVYKNNQIEKLGSKFYESKISKDKISYVFNMPTNESDTILINTFKYRFDTGKDITVTPTRKKNAYYLDIDIPLNSEKISGYFKEGVKQRFNLGLNKIYTVDSIK